MKQFDYAYIYVASLCLAILVFLYGLLVNPLWWVLSILLVAVSLSISAFHVLDGVGEPARLRRSKDKKLEKRYKLNVSVMVICAILFMTSAVLFIFRDFYSETSFGKYVEKKLAENPINAKLANFVFIKVDKKSGKRLP